MRTSLFYFPITRNFVTTSVKVTYESRKKVYLHYYLFVLIV